MFNRLHAICTMSQLAAVNEKTPKEFPYTSKLSQSQMIEPYTIGWKLMSIKTVQRHQSSRNPIQGTSPNLPNPARHECVSITLLRKNYKTWVLFNSCTIGVRTSCFDLCSELIYSPCFKSIVPAVLIYNKIH